MAKTKIVRSVAGPGNLGIYRGDSLFDATVLCNGFPPRREVMNSQDAFLSPQSVTFSA